MTSQSVNLAVIEAEIKRIRSLGLEKLRSEWRMTFGRAPPPGLSKDILARMIAYRKQEQACGGLDRETVKLLDSLARGGRPGRDPARKLKAGTVLVREYGGDTHTVTVVPGGFVWRGETYSSLSNIAKLITGTAWNGPRFFGLRSPRGERESAASARRDREPDGRKAFDLRHVDRPSPPRRQSTGAGA